MPIRVDDNPGDAAFLVCAPVTDPLLYPDNRTGACSFCGCTVQYRPHVPPGLTLACVECMLAHKPADAEMVVTSQTIGDLAKLVADEALRRKRNVLPRCCMEAFVAWGASTGFKESPTGATFTCPECGQDYQLVPKHPGERAKWTPVNRVQ